MGIIVKAIGTGVGFVAEAASRNKDKDKDQDLSNATASLRISQKEPNSEKLALEKHQSRSSSSSSDPSESDFDSSDDEAHWALDDEAAKLTPKRSHDFQGQVKLDSIVTEVLSKSKPPPYDIPSSGMPVILPQRRPGARGRGFVRAYAPALNEYGIDQATFLSFVENFDVAIKASPALNVIMVGAGIAGLVPHGYAMLASTVAQVVVGAAMEAQQRHRGNSYMDQMNEKLFKPRGLYAVVMTYVPNAQRPVSAQQTDFNALVDGTATKEGGLLGAKLQKGESYGELELPESAPLVFPGVDEATRQKLLEENAMKRGARWTADYMDRRGQARYIHNNPDSKLNPTADGEKPTFKSSLGDPNHPAFQGSWPTLFSGGRIAPKQKVSKEEKRARKQERRDEKRARKHGGDYYRNDVYCEDAYGQPIAAPRNVQRQPQPTKKQKKKMAKSKICYLMVLPIPSQSELRELSQQVGGFTG